MKPSSDRLFGSTCGAFLVAVGALSLSTGCKSSPEGCVAGASVSCACSSGAQGAQVCKSDQTFGPCSCTSPTTVVVGAPGSPNETPDGFDMEKSPAVQAVKSRYADVGTRQRLFVKTAKGILGLPSGTNAHDFTANLVIYTEKGSVRKVVRNFFGPALSLTSEAQVVGTSELYFWNNQLDFVFETGVAAANDGEAWPHGPGDENRLYFENGKLIWWVTSKERTVVAVGRYPAKETSTLNTARLLGEAAATAGNTLRYENGKFQETLEGD